MRLTALFEILRSSFREPRRAVVPSSLPSSGGLKTILTAFNLFLVFALLGTTLLMLGRIFARLEPAIASDLRWRAERGAEDLVHEGDMALAVRDIPALSALLARRAADPDVLYAVFADPHRHILVETGAPPAPLERLVVGSPGMIENGAGYMVSWRWSTMDTETLGLAAVVVSTKRIQEGEGLRQSFLELTGLACLLAVALSFIFVGVYIGPLIKMTEDALRDLTELNGTLDRRVRERTTELAISNTQLTESVSRLREMQRQLIEASRKSGMADVASAVLHNVGNVLTSVNVSAGLVAETLANSRIQGLQRVSALLLQHETDLERYLSHDPGGRRLPSYLIKLSDVVKEEQTMLFSELRGLQKNIDHIKAVVDRQQAQASGVGGVVETVLLAELLDDALRFHAASCEKHRIQVERDYEQMGPISLDRHRVFQIIMNLMSNARDALQSVAPEERRLFVRSRLPQHGWFAIEVGDTGCGVDQKDLTRIFGLRFTTKADGHGFGLHSSACAAQEMGGRLTCHSEGSGRGAKFILELPFETNEVTKWSATRMSRPLHAS